MATYSERFLEYMRRLLSIEGFVSNNCLDRGGLTLAGIARNMWPDLHLWVLYDQLGGKVKGNQAVYDEIYAFYYTEFWLKLQGDFVGPKLAWELLDFGVNAGVATAVTALQRILDAHNKNGALWPDLPGHGKFGDITKAAFQSMTRQGYTDEDFALMVNALQFAHYIGIVERTPSQETFMNGWSKARVLEKS